MDEGGRRRLWQRVGLTLAGVLVIGGLLLIAAIVLFAVWLNSWSSNK